MEILSGTKEETHNHTRLIIQGLMEENSRLRSLLRDLGGFLGEGLGGPLLDKTGWSMDKFRDFTSRADSDAAYEAFVKAKQGGGGERERNGSSGSMMHQPTNSNSNEASGSRTKRKRDSDAAPTPEANDGGPSNRRSYSGSVPKSSNNGLGSSSRRASSPNELQSLLPTNHGAHSQYDRRESHPSNFSSLVNTLSTSSAAPFISLAPQVPPSNNPNVALDGYSVGTSPHDSATPRASLLLSESVLGGSILTGLVFIESGTSGSAEVAARRQQEYQENESKRNEAGKLIKYVSLSPMPYPILNSSSTNLRSLLGIIWITSK